MSNQRTNQRFEVTRRPVERQSVFGRGAYSGAPLLERGASPASGLCNRPKGSGI
jgi:hypothetical protein